MASYLPYTAEDAGIHPRFWISNNRGDGLGVLTQAQLRARCLGSGDWVGTYGLVKSFASARLDTSKYPNSYYDNEKPEYAMAHAFVWQVESLGSYARRAIDIAKYIAGLSMGSDEDDWRARAMLMAVVYDWCFGYSLFTGAEKDILKKRVADYVKVLYPDSGNEYIWGTDHGNIVYGIMALSCILNDGWVSGSADYLNSTWFSWMDSMMDAHDDGTQVGFLPVFRHFGNDDGGSHKGAGQSSYVETNEQFHIRLFPCMQSALGQDWYTSEAWWKKWMHWQLWHWRCDHTLHVQGDCQQQAHYSVYLQAHAMQVAAREAGDFGLACQWLMNQIQDHSDLGWAIWGPYNMYYCLWANKAKGITPTNPPAPTIAGYGGGSQMKVFSKAGKIVFREGWAEDGASVTHSCPKKFTGGHQHRDAGHWDFAFQGKIMLGMHGHYTGSQTITYKRESVWSTPLLVTDPTGHRYSFYKQLITKNVVRIYDSDEPAESDLDSFHHSNSHTSHFGVYNEGSGNVDVDNQGGQRWPKDTSYTNPEPDDLTDIEGGGAEAKWVFDSWPVASPPETSQCAYFVGNLLPFYHSNKVTRYKRHLVWVKAGTIAGWTRPVLIVWDDLITHVDVDGTYGGKKTQILQLQPFVVPTGDAAELIFTDAPAKLTAKILKPTMEKTVVTGYYSPKGIHYPPTKATANDDDGPSISDESKAIRVELNPAASGGTQSFLQVYFQGRTDDPALPAVVLFEDGSYIGVHFNSPTGPLVKIAKGDSHAVTITTDPAPAAPTGLVATPYSTSRIDLDWADNVEGDLNHYNVYKSKLVGGVYDAWGAAYAAPVVSTQQVTGLDADSTYRFKVTAVDTGSNESEDSVIVSANTLAPPPASGSGAGLAPWRSGRRFSKFSLDLR